MKALRTCAIIISIVLNSWGCSKNQINSSSINVQKPSPTPATSAGTALILYDGHGNDFNGKFGKLYSIMLRSLLGHFNYDADLVAIEDYTAAKIENYPISFYIGSYFDNPLPATFLNDVAQTDKKFVWFKYNIWQLTTNPTYGFSSRFGLSFQSLRSLDAVPSASNPSPGFFNTVQYKGKSLVKYYNYNSTTNVINADPDISVMQITNPFIASSYAPIINSQTSEVAPYIIHANNFWFVADAPFTFVGPRDRYLVFCDALHDILGIQHAENHRALVRFEDVAATVNKNNLMALADTLHAQQVPFSIATIPHYMDPLGAYTGGVSDEVALSDAHNLKQALNYSISKGGSIVAHGFTHQYGSMQNYRTGASGDDYEFWNIVDEKPIDGDSTSWALDRVDSASYEFLSNGFSPFAWEAPHYQASPIDYRAFTERYGTFYHRVIYYTSETPQFLGTSNPNRDLMAGLFFPYLIERDYYGQRVIPENLGNIAYNVGNVDPAADSNITWQDLLANADAGLVVRDGFASFFYHPYWLDPSLGITNAMSDFNSLISGIKNLGYTFVSASDLAQGLTPAQFLANHLKTQNRKPASGPASHLPAKRNNSKK